MRGIRRLPLDILLAAVVVALVAACAAPAASQAPLATPSPANLTATGSASLAPTPTPSTTASQPGASTMPFILTSSAFAPGAAIPRKFSCDGANVSPTLSWDGAPEGTASLALIVDDPDAHGFVHWVVFNMTGSQSGGLPEGVSKSPDAPPQGTNSRGAVGWFGPCPPSGTHHYRFTLLALNQILPLTGAPKADDVRRAAEGSVLEQAVLTGTYRRG